MLMKGDINGRMSVLKLQAIGSTSCNAGTPFSIANAIV